jgi:16S rRNA (cytosine1402-N4)-methyltransferase
MMAAHFSVLLQESTEALAIRPDGIYVDGTFGRGGHSKAILELLSSSGRIVAIDKDQEAVEYAKAHFANDPRFTIIQGSFAKLREIAQELGILGRINGILLDLGVSSPQLDNPGRGFSFLKSGPLDMRMDLQQDFDAQRFINHAPAQELESVFRTYGEERYAKRIAGALVTARANAPIQTTDVLAELVKAAHPRWEKHKHPATRVFQAIRIHINQELADLSSCLKQCVDVLAVGGRLVVISFHSLEDRIVKQFMRSEEQGLCPPPSVPVRARDIKTSFKRIGKAIKPKEGEIRDNIRSRSAVLRIGEKIS